MGSSITPTTDACPEKSHSPTNNKWHKAKRILTIAFFILVPILLFMLVKHIDWAEVGTALRKYDVKTLLIGAAIALASFLVFASYDLIGRSYTGHRLPVRQ